jgi:hypothetical protein
MNVPFFFPFWGPGANHELGDWKLDWSGLAANIKEGAEK